MKDFLSMYVTLMPTVLAGVVNAVFCSKSWFSFIKKPIDGGRILGDGERLFGENKTWKGFWGYIILGALFSLLWGLIVGAADIETYDYFYVNHENTHGFNLLIGALQGLAYALFELPNSFLKRRFHIVPGKNPSGPKRGFFIFLDQSDSMFGVVLVVALFYSMPLWFYFLYVLVGAVTHILLNMVLYACKVRKNKL